MKNMERLCSIILLLFLILILIVLSMSVSAFAEDNEQTKEETMYRYSLKDFWENYDYEDIGYHVIDPMEKIYLIKSEEPLEIQIERERGEDSLLEHFLGLTVTWVYSISDPTIINYEQMISPDYKVKEKNGVLIFIFEKENLKSLVDLQRYEFLFSFDDGKAYSLIWATEESDKLVYREEGHVFINYPPLPDDLPSPAENLTKDVEIGVTDNAPQVVIDDIDDENSEVGCISMKPVLLISFAIGVIVILLLYVHIAKK